jgi:hypothetical protein
LCRNNGLLSFNTTWNALKTTPPTIIRSRGNVFPSLPSKDTLFVAAGTSFRSRYLATLQRLTDSFFSEDTHLNRKWSVQQLYCCEYSLPRELFTEPLPSNENIYTLPSLCLATKGGIHIQTHRLMVGIYEVRRSDGLGCHDIQTKFRKDWLRHSLTGDYTDTLTAWWSHKPTLIFSK